MARVYWGMLCKGFTCSTVYRDAQKCTVCVRVSVCVCTLARAWWGKYKQCEWKAMGGGVSVVHV